MKATGYGIIISSDKEHKQEKCYAQARAGQFVYLS